jgi:signal transduction histidine kinase
LLAQKPVALLDELNAAKTPKEKVGLLVKLADQYAYKKDYQKALEYLARAMKLNKEEAMYKFNDGALTQVLSEETLQAMTLAQFKTYISRLPEDILTADFLNLLANRTFKVYNSSFALELAQKALRLSLAQRDKLQQATAYLALSNFFSNRDHEESKSYARKAAKSFGEVRDTFGIIKSLILFGRKTSEPNEADRALDDALALSVCYEDEALIYECLMRRRDLERNRGNFREAQKLEVSIYESALKTRDTFKILESIWDKGVTLLYMGNYREAMPYFEQVLRQDKKDKSNFTLSHQYSILGECYWGIGVYDSAVFYYQKAIEIAKKYQHTRNLCKSLQDLAMLHLELDNKNAALEYAQQARQVYATVEVQNFPIVRSNYYQWQADFFKKNAQNDSAFVYASKFLDYLTSKAMTKDIPSALQLLGDTYVKLGKWELGQQQLLQALHQARDIGMEGQQCKTLLILSELMLQRGEYRQAIKYLEESLDLAQKLNQRSLLMDIYRNLTTAHAKAGNFENAYRFQTTLKNLEDSLFGFVQKEQIAKFEASFKVKEKELENERLEAEKLGKDYIIQKRNSQIISLGVIIVFLLIAAYLFKERAKVKAANVLRKQITRDIHDDVGSTLNDLKMTIKEALEEKSTDQEKLKRAVQLGNQAMDSLKNLIWNIDKKEVALHQFAGEVRALTSDILSTHQIPFQFDAIGFDAKRPLSQIIYHHLLMIYKEALQNAVKHGDYKQITIDLVYAADGFLLKIKNSCPKMAAAMTGTNKGLLNMKERAAILKGEILFQQTEGFFEIKLKVSL